jgi:NMD protein affecting ribosome stability and mRNA decay
MKKAQVPRPGAPRGRRNAGRAQLAEIEDPYKARAKLAEPSRCKSCGAVYRRGRWRWAEPPAAARQVTCQACRRIADKLPAGIVALAGDYIAGRETELEQLIRNQEEAERSEHPMNRVMAIKRGKDGITVTTTDIHLPRRIAETVRRTHRGRLSYDYDPGGYFVRVNWRRDA